MAPLGPAAHRRGIDRAALAIARPSHAPAPRRRRAISASVGALSIGIGGIVGGGIFATIGLAAVQAQGAAWLSFLVGGVVALLTAYAYVRLTLAFPGQGGTVTFIDRAFGDGLFAAGLNTLLVFSYVMVMALYAMAFANYGHHSSPSRHSRRPGAGVDRRAGPGQPGRPALVERSEGALNLVKLRSWPCSSWRALPARA